MRYLAFPGWETTSSKRQDGYLNQQVILFGLKYETHSLQAHPKLPCRSVVAPTPNLLEWQYDLRLDSCSLSMFSQSVAVLTTFFAFSVVPHLFCCRPASPTTPYLSLLSRISATVLIRWCLTRWSCMPSPLSQMNNTPSGWQSFPVDICPLCRRPYNPFRHVRSHTSHLLPFHISSATVSIPVVVHLLHHARPPLSSPLTLSAICTSCVSVAVLITLSTIVPCTLPLLFIYLFPVGSSPRSALLYTSLLDMI